jgi:hypothetical protein
MYPHRHFRVHKQWHVYPICCFWIHKLMYFSAFCFAIDNNVATKTHPNAKPPLSVVRCPLSTNSVFLSTFSQYFIQIFIFQALTTIEY